MVATRRGASVESPDRTKAEKSLKTDSSPTRVLTRTRRTTATKTESHSEDACDLQHEEAEDMDSTTRTEEVQSSAVKRITRSTSRQTRTVQQVESLNEVEISEAESCCSNVSSGRVTRSRRTPAVARAKSALRADDDDDDDDDGGSEAESCSSSISTAGRRTSRSLRGRMAPLHKPVTKLANSETENSEAESCCSDMSGARAFGAQRSTRSRSCAAPPCTPSKSQTEDKEPSEAETHATSLSSLQGSAVRRSARKRQERTTVPASTVPKKKAEASSASPLSSSSRRALRAKTQSVSESQSSGCNKAVPGPIGSQDRFTYSQAESKTTEEVTIISDTESEDSLTCTGPPSQKNDAKQEVATKFANSSRTGSGSSRHAASPLETIAEERAKTFQSPAAVPKESEKRLQPESSLPEISKDSQSSSLLGSQPVCPSEELTTSKTNIEETEGEETMDVALSESSICEMEKTMAKRGSVAKLDPVEGKKDSSGQCSTAPQESQFISLLLSSDDENDGDESKELDFASGDDDDDEDEVSQGENQAALSKSPLDDGLFVIDTQPGLQPDKKYYLDTKGICETRESEEEEEEYSDEEADEGKDAEEFIDEEDEDTAILLKSKKPPLIELSSSIDPGLNMKQTGGLYISLDGGKIKSGPSALQKLKEKKKKDELLRKSVITPDFEKKDAVPPYLESKDQLKKKRREERAKTTGDSWYNMKAPELTEELKNDLKALKMRSALDPKRFYKKNDREGFPKYFQVGTVVDDPVDFYHARIPKKQRKRTIVEELIADAEFRSYNKKKYKQILAERAALAAGKKNRKKNKFHKK
ncbi:deoxynucleotidyltransferase terminal-interacting protein 2 [Lepisosteus oculatus]|uniref:deoxynucleotidyltransferase terminal-interacting protein 2 n=1 Tax=Lepisosteus oculatus TaxID=7918 RepID=UPI00371B6892